MIALFKQYKLIAAGVVLALAFGAGMVVRGWWAAAIISDLKAEHAAYREAISSEHAQKLVVLAGEQQALQNRISAMDQQRYGELRHAQQEIERLSAAVADGSRRLSVRASCPASAGSVSASTGTGRVDDGAQRADIHPADAGRIVAITGAADACAVKLSALQDWARSVANGAAR
ncbi:lysis protein [Pseudomonas sp. KSR10]|uniref:lysis system i-spanin subunit Rz n=1 Tax=Pseudomonas sp. KSR10 TaxID=2916654 RepID=UPI001EF82E3B|nr:lysis system i-spanin subunit Rz [Pseudomonas sp. KSR10]MCG6541902.1 lysis protein [Pseudomonas sp. KSR10]